MNEGKNRKVEIREPELKGTISESMKNRIRNITKKIRHRGKELDGFTITKKKSIQIASLPKYLMSKQGTIVETSTTRCGAGELLFSEGKINFYIWLNELRPEEPDIIISKSNMQCRTNVSDFNFGRVLAVWDFVSGGRKEEDATV